MGKTIVKKKDLQKLISESIKRKKGLTIPSINHKSLNENINTVHNKIRIAIVKEGIKTLNLQNYKPILLEQGYYDRNPGIAAAEGLENVIKGLKKAYDMVTDENTGKMIMNSITRLGNTMSVIGTYMGSGKSQRGVDEDWLYSQLKDIPYPEVEAAEEGNESAAAKMKKSYMADF